MSLDRLIEKVIRTGNPTVVGLDPRLEYVPEYLREEAFTEKGRDPKGAAYALWRFNKAIIDAVCDIVPAVKPQSAYYEMYGRYGAKTLSKTVEYARKKGMFVILDGKRNDIGATMEAYANAYLGGTVIDGNSFECCGADALTVNGYLGTDGITPLTDLCKKNDRGIFVLVKTSNPSSGELQDRRLEDGRTVYEAVGEMCEKWGSDNIGRYGYSAVGAVIGATYPAQLEEMRDKLPHTFFLVPGYGAQGGGAEGVAKAFDPGGLGAVVNSSRAVMCAYKKEECDPHDFAGAARRECIRMREDITRCVPALS